MALDSTGGVSHGKIEMKDGGKYSSYTATVTNAEGKSNKFKGVVKKEDKDTLMFHAAVRGGELEGPGPEYELKRVRRARGKKATDAVK